MSVTPSQPEPTDLARQRDEDAQYYRGILHELVEMATDIARAVHRQAASEPAATPAEAPTPDPTIAFDRIARTLRRTIALARKITDPTPPRPAAQAAERRRIARKQIIRDVEDTIQRRAEGADAEALQAEFYERLETIDCEDDIANLPIAEIVALIRRDLGLAHLPGTHPWKRRRPAGPARALRPRSRAYQDGSAQPRSAPDCATAPLRRTAPAHPDQHRPAATLIGVPGRDASLRVPARPRAARIIFGTFAGLSPSVPTGNMTWSHHAPSSAPGRRGDGHGAIR